MYTVKPHRMKSKNLLWSSEEFQNEVETKQKQKTTDF